MQCWASQKQICLLYWALYRVYLNDCSNTITLVL